MVRKVLLVAAFIASTAAHAQWWNPNDPTPPKFRGTQWATAPVYTHQMMENAAQQVHIALETGDFAKVERMYAEFLESQLRTNDGIWMLESVTPEGRQLFRERLAKAAEAVDASEAVGRDSPYWYWVALGVAGSTGKSASELDAFFERGASKFPTYQPLYSTRINYLLPQWGGDFDKVDSFIDASVRRTAATEGNTFYVRLYMDVAKGTPRSTDFFQDTRVSWPRMRESFEELNRRYPDSWNKSLYAGFACRVRDRETTAKLLQDMQPNAEVFAFKDGISMDTCRRFAFDRS